MRIRLPSSLALAALLAAAWPAGAAGPAMPHGLAAAAQQAVAPAVTTNTGRALPRPRPRPAPRPEVKPEVKPDVRSEVRLAADVLTADEIERLRASLQWAARRGLIGGSEAVVGEADAGEADAGGTMPGRTMPDGTMPGEAHPDAAMPASAAPAADAGTSAPPAAANPEPQTMACKPADGPPLVDWRAADDQGRGFLAGLGAQRDAAGTSPAPAALQRLALQRLALFYLTQGLTSEALAALQALDPPPPALHAAALILLGRGEEAGAALPDLAACPADGAVWQAAWLAARHSYADAAALAASSAETLAAFPEHPRTVLALQLADAALRAGKPEFAADLLGRVAPAPGQAVAGPESVLRGRIALALGQAQRAGWYFAAAADAGEAARREARLALIGHAIEHGTPLPDGAAEALRGALFDYRGERRLLPVALMAADVLARNGHHAEALAALSDAQHRLPPGVSAAPLAARARALLWDTVRAEDGPVRIGRALQLFTDHGGFLTDDAASDAIRSRLAARLLAAGLPSAADRVLAPLAERPQAADAAPQTARLRAEAKLRRGDAEAALALLTAPNAPGDAAATGLRRQALARLGRYEEAAALADAAGDAAAAARYARLVAPAPAQSAADGAATLRALAAAYMAAPKAAALPDGANASALAVARAAGLGDAAAALTAPPLPAGLPLPDAVALVLERSRQVRALSSVPPSGS